MSTSATELMEQAPMTVEFYLRRGIKVIDEELGASYSKKHPELLAAWVTACTRDFDSAVSAGALEIDEMPRDLTCRHINFSRRLEHRIRNLESKLNVDPPSPYGPEEEAA